MSSIFLRWQFIAFVVIVLIIIIGTILDIRAERKRRNERRRVTEANWLRAKSDLERWLSDNSIKSIDSPESQYLLSIEIGAFMLYLEHKEPVSESDHRYLRNKVALLSDKTVYRNPYF